MADLKKDAGGPSFGGQDTRTGAPYGDPGYAGAGARGDQGYGPGTATPGQRPPGAPASNAQTWALAAHLSGPVGAVVSLGVLMVVGPLVVMLTEGTRDHWVRRQAVEALNFAITGLIAMAAAYVIMLVSFGLLFVAPIAVGIAYVVLGVIASLRVQRGEDYRYPLTLRLVR